MMRRFSSRLAWRVFWMVTILPHLAGADPGIQYIGRDEGLPSTQVHAVVEAGDGFVWFAGPSGLMRYDGWRIVTFGRDDGLTSHGLRALAVDQRQRLWLGTDAGIDIRENDGTIRPLVPGAWRFGIVDAIAPGPDETMWIATARGLLAWSAAAGLRPIEDPRLADRRVSAVATDARGRVWAAVPGVGLLRRDGDAWTHVQPPGLELVGTVQTVAASPRGGLLIGGDRGLAELDADGTAAVLIGEVSAAGMVSAVVETGDELWLGRGGELRLFRRRQGRWQPTRVAFDTGLINDFAVDRLGNLWAATDRVGVAKISSLRRGVETAASPCRSQVFAIFPDADGYLVGGDQCSWTISEDGRIRRHLEGLDRIKVWDLLRAGDGTLWAATENGLYRGSGERPVAPAGLGSATLDAPGRVLLERGGSLWVGTVTGLVEIRGREVHERHDTSGSPLGYVYTLERGPQDRIWAGTIGNGLWRETGDGGFERVSSGDISTTGNVYTLAFGPLGQVIIAEDDRLVQLAEDGSTRRLSTRGDAIAAWSLIFDRDGRLWAGGSAGLIRYDLEAGTPELRLTSTMGLAGDEFTTSRSLAVARDGRLLCGLDGGLTIVAPGELTRSTELPEVRLLDVAWSNARLEAAPPLEPVVREGPWTLEVAVAAPWFVDERSLTYRYRLRGFDPDWRPAAAFGPQIRYTGLPPGTYTLEAQARSPFVGWGPASDLLALRVNPPWWRGPWALAAYLVLLAAGVLALWRWRNRQLLARSRELEREVGERTEELRHIAAHDELTGLPNQRTFWEQAKRHAALAKRDGVDLALAVLDLDDFKQVNDTYGHRVGDQVLGEVARRLLAAGRESDLLARYGGEEFVVLMPSTSEPEAIQAAERLRRALARSPFRLPEGLELKVAASFGVSSLEGPEDEVEALFKRADSAVYVAKRTKNTVAVWDRASSSP